MPTHAIRSHEWAPGLNATASSRDDDWVRLMSGEIVGSKVGGQLCGKVSLDAGRAQVDGFLPGLRVVGVAEAVYVDLCIGLRGAGDDGVLEIVGIEGEDLRLHGADHEFADVRADGFGHDLQGRA